MMMEHAGIQPCIICTSKRQVVDVEFVTKNYEIQTFECPHCESRVRLVQRTTRKAQVSRVDPYWRNVRIPASCC